MRNFPIEGYTLPGWAVQAGMTEAFPYHGPSMNPTFENGDFVYVRPAARYRPGDVIVFQSPDDEKLIIHRVIAVREHSLATRGDHNLNNDPPVLPGQVVGRVEYVETKRGLRRVRNGVSGLWWARGLWLRLAMGLAIRRLFWQPYNIIREKRLVAFLWRPEIVRVRIKTKEGCLVKCLYHNRTIAIYEPDSGKFLCRKPFDLFIDLPDDHPTII